jgi:TonB family protein
MTRLTAAFLALTVLVPSVTLLGAEATPAVKVSGTDVPPPDRTKSVNPVYPPEALALGASAVVVLELVIDEQGKVAEVKVVHGAEPFAAAAAAAARQWEYKVSKVDGVPVRVRKTEPIRFAAKLPETRRDAGVPELRQGVGPVTPAASRGKTGRATAHLEVDGDGHVTDATVVSGESPWTEALMTAIRTWRFAASESGTAVAFEVAADFKDGKAALDLTRPQPRGEGATAVAANAATPTASPTTAGAVPPVDGKEAVPVAPAAADATPTPTQKPSPTAASTEPVIEVVRGGRDIVRPAAPDAPATPPPVPENGLSSIRDVELAAGIPDLVKGRRPVSPPLARLGAMEGDIDVRFSIDSGGVTSVNNVSGREELKAAAESLVRSWVFRRTAANRLYAIAHVEYRVAGVKAKIQPAP